MKSKIALIAFATLVGCGLIWVAEYYDELKRLREMLSEAMTPDYIPETDKPKDPYAEAGGGLFI